LRLMFFTIPPPGPPLVVPYVSGSDVRLNRDSPTRFAVRGVRSDDAFGLFLGRSSDQKISPRLLGHFSFMALLAGWSRRASNAY